MLAVFLFALPLASLILLLMRRWLALFPFAISLALFALWFLYYATDWFGPAHPGVPGVVVAVVLLGWIGVWAAIFGPPRTGVVMRRSARHHNAAQDGSGARRQQPPPPQPRA